MAYFGYSSGHRLPSLSLNIETIVPLETMKGSLSKWRTLKISRDKRLNDLLNSNSDFIRSSKYNFIEERILTNIDISHETDDCSK